MITREQAYDGVGKLYVKGVVSEVKGKRALKATIGILKAYDVVEDVVTIAPDVHGTDIRIGRCYVSVIRSETSPATAFIPTD